MLKSIFKFIALTLIVCSSIPLNAQQPNDCVNAVTVCGDSDIILDVSGDGNNSNEFPDSCSSNENNSLWMEVSVTTTGTLAFTLTPSSPAITEDYDFFIFGPNTTCGNLGPTIRCSTTNPQASGQGNNLTGLNTTETDTSEGPGAAGNSFVSAINATAGDTYFIVIDRPIGNSPFSLTWTGTAQFSDAPVSDTDNTGQGLDLTDCDSVAPFNDGQTLFNLETNTSLMVGPQTDVTTAYYASESDANIGVNPLTSPYTSTNNGQTIYATLTNTTTNCFIIQEFQLFVSNQPTINTPPDMVVCDDISNDGVEPFNLESQNNTVLGGQGPFDYDITYHLNQVDADGNLNTLMSPYTNISNPQTLFVRMESVTNAACFSTTTFDLIVDPTPVINTPPNLERCDDGLNDQIELFNLDAQTNAVLGTQNPADFTVTYHETATDADMGTNALVSPFPNVTNPDQIFIRITPNTGNTACYNFSVTPFELIVNPLPLSTTLPNYEVCDDDNDGFATFDLTTQSAAAINGQANITATYFVLLADAIANTNAIPNPAAYINSVVDMETIHIRLENTNTTCFTTTPLTLEVNPTPVIPTISDYRLCDNATDGDDTNGFTEFDLTSQDVTIINGQANTTVAYFETAADAIGNVNVIPNPATYTNMTVNMQIIHIRVENTMTTCVQTGLFNIVVDELPEVQNSILIQCDEDGIPDGFTEYNLNEANENVMVNGDTTGFNYTHHLNLADAQNSVNAVNPAPFTNTTNPQTIYVRVENATTGCFRTAEYVLEVTATDIGNAGLNECDDDYDGFTEFNLSDADATILAALPPGLTVDYYATANDAQLEINQLPNLYTNTTAFVQTLFIRVENANDCFGIANMDIVVDPLPQNNMLSDFIACSDTANSAAIDLTQFDPDVLGTQNAADFTITYHETQLDADNGNNILTSPYNNTSNPQTLFVSVENNATGCSISTINFDIVVNVNPTAVTPTDFEVCDDATTDGITSFNLTIKNNEIAGGNPNYTVTYYINQADADAEVNPLAIPYTNTTPNMQQIFVRVEDNTTGCYDTTTLDLQVEQAPIAFTPNDLIFCDPDSDGFGMFTLTEADAAITGGAPGLTVTYHETQPDAENNVNALSSPYNNITVNTQTIYVRVESATIATNCASYVELQLVVNPTPQITDPTPLEVCDDNADGFATFDLPTKDPEVLNLLDADPTNDLDPAQYSVTYYPNEADAIADTNAIATPNAYVNTASPQQTIGIRVNDNTNTCYKVTTLLLIVNDLPVLVQPDPLELCDYDNPGDEIELFTLEDANAQILNGQTGITLTYFSTQLGADTNDAAVQIVSPYANTANTQTIYVRAQNDVTTCVSTITLDLRVNPLPSPVAMPVALEDCDDDNDGFGEFDLDSQIPFILNGEPDVTITFYETQGDAMSMTNALISPYTNIVANMQTIYVRAENDITNCYTIVELPLVVQPSPVVPTAIDDYVVCDDDQDGFSQFDFISEINPQVFTNGQTAADYTLSYHTLPGDADTGNNPIVNTGNFTNQANPQDIYIRLESNANGCVTTGSFTIEVAFPPVLDPTYDNELSECDDLDANYMEDNDGITVFDLTQEDAELVNGNTSWIVTYYETQADAQADTNAIANPTAYTNMTTGPQTLYIRVTDNDTGCFSFTTVTIRVLPNPSPSPDPMDLILCDDTNAGDLIETFDLTQNETFIINGEAGVSASYYTSQNDAVMNTNAIVDPTLHTNEDPANPGTGMTPQTIYVRVTNGDDATGLNGTGCFSLVSFDVIVNPLPTVTPVADYIICELMTDDVADFDLETMTAAILNGQDPAIFTVSYHETQTDADTAMNALSSPYTNTSDPQTIYVNITNTLTGCDTAVLTFDLQVQEAAQANPDGTPIVYEVCDDNMEFDNDPSNDTTSFDLATQNPFVLDGQDPANYTVSYYDNQTDADAGTNPLPFIYTNTANPQVIIVRVDNDIMIDDGMGGMVDSSSCYETATLTLQVNPIPAFNLDDTYLLCVNTNGTEVINTPTIDTGLDPSQYSFEWYYEGNVLAGETGPSIDPTNGGNYTVVVTDTTTSPNTMCSSSDTTLVNVSEPPVVAAEVITLAFANQHDIQVTASTTATNAISIYEFSLDGGSWEANTPNDFTYTFTDVAAGEHSITVRDSVGCGETTITIMVMDYPLYFTPNGDGYHDTWNIYAIGNQPDAVIYIFDRYGKLLKQLSPTGAGWDGTYNGNPMPTSDYWFSVEYREPSTDEKKIDTGAFYFKTIRSKTINDKQK